MNPNREQLIRNAISEVLEAMFFVSVDFSEPTQIRASSFPCCSSIQLRCDTECVEIGIAVTEAFGKMIAANFLGIEETLVKSEELEDVLKELANMSGGNYLSRTDSGSWELGIPSSRKLSESSDTFLRGSPMDTMGEPAGLVFIEITPIHPIIRA